ncbi:hypothetical protein KI387_038457, partial [Taxus chinensis]
IHDVIDLGVHQTNSKIIPKKMVITLRGVQMVGHVEEALEEDFVVMVTVEEEVSSHVEPVTTVDLRNTISVNALICYNALGVGRSI